MRVKVPRSSHSRTSDDHEAPLSPGAATRQQAGPAASHKLKLKLGSPKQPGMNSPNSHVGLGAAQAPDVTGEPAQAAHGQKKATGIQQQRKPRSRSAKPAAREAAIEVLANGASPSGGTEQQPGQQPGQQRSKQQPRKRQRSRKEPATAADSETDAGICDAPKQRRRRSHKRAPAEQEQRQEQPGQHAGGGSAAAAALQDKSRKSGRPPQPKVRPLSPTGRPPRKPRAPRKPAASGSTGATAPPPPQQQQQQQETQKQKQEQEPQPDPQKKHKQRKKHKQQQQQQEGEREGQHRDDVYKKAVRRAYDYVHRIKAEEHAIHTYAADGWKGASREKVQLTDELQQAQGRMARCQAAIKNAVRVCEEAQGDTAIAADLFDSDGELDETHIFCARCRGRDSHDDNDIILCDGPCNRAYHECCLSPRIRAGELPEDEGWLCPACDAKADIMHELNDVFGTSYTIDTRWQDLFNPEQEQLRLRRLCSDPLSPRALGGVVAAAAAAAAGVGGAAGGELGVLLGGDLPSEDDSDFSFSEDESAAHSLQQHSCSHDSGAASSSGSDGEEVGTSAARGRKSNSSPQQQRSSKRRRRSSGSGAGQHTRQQGGKDAEDSQEEEPEGRLLDGKRRKPRVDYRALALQMFGGLDVHADDEEDDEDYKNGR